VKPRGRPTEATTGHWGWSQAKQPLHRRLGVLTFPAQHPRRLAQPGPRLVQPTHNTRPPPRPWTATASLATPARGNGNRASNHTPASSAVGPGEQPASLRQPISITSTTRLNRPPSTAQPARRSHKPRTKHRTHRRTRQNAPQQLAQSENNTRPGQSTSPRTAASLSHGKHKATPEPRHRLAATPPPLGPIRRRVETVG